MFMIPHCAKYLVPESEHNEIIYDFLSEIMVHTEDLILFPIRIQSALEFSRAFQVVAEGFLDLCPHNSIRQ